MKEGYSENLVVAFWFEKPSINRITRLIYNNCPPINCDTNKINSIYKTGQSEIIPKTGTFKLVKIKSDNNLLINQDW